MHTYVLRLIPVCFGVPCSNGSRARGRGIEYKLFGSPGLDWTGMMGWNDGMEIDEDGGKGIGVICTS